MRLLAPVLVLVISQPGSAHAQSASDKPSAGPTAPVFVTTTKRTAVRIGSVSLPLNEGTKLEVLGRESNSLVVMFRAAKGKVVAADTDFNPTTTAVPELAPEPSTKSADITISTTPAGDPAAQGQDVPASSNRAASSKRSVEQPLKKDPKPVRPAKESAPPPPVNN
jgi:hypothetical protein